MRWESYFANELILKIYKDGKRELDLAGNTKKEWNAQRKRLVSAIMREALASKKIDVKGNSYSIIKKIGEGGFSSVYQVYNEDKNLCALKVVNLLGSDGYTDQKLKNEIELLKVMNALFSIFV